MKSLILKTALLFFTLFFFSLDAFTQTRIETLNYICNIMKEGTQLNDYGYIKEVKYPIDGSDKINLISEYYSSYSSSRFHYTFYVASISGINLKASEIQIVVPAQCISTSTSDDKKSLNDVKDFYIKFASAEIAKEKYVKIEKALTHLAKEYDGKYNYDIFAN